MSDSDVQEIAVGSESLSGREAKAKYSLENTIKCPHCERDLGVLKVVRLLRTRVNFPSNLPSRGRVLACPGCQKIVSAELAGFA